MTFEKGKSYKTVGGWEAIYLGKDSDGDNLFAHLWGNKSEIEIHNDKGEQYGSHVDDNRDTVTTEEYTEPRKGEVWVNVYDDGDTTTHEKLEYAKGFQRMAIPQENKCIARKRIQWTEGEYDE